MNDPNRSHYERYYRAREAEPHEGIEWSQVGTGSEGVIEECQRYEEKIDRARQAITTLTYNEWLERFTHLSRSFLGNAISPAAIGGYEYKGIQNDDMWGEIHFFERSSTLSASDRYPDFPTVETLKFDRALGGTIEWRRTVIDGDTSVVHAMSRMVKWEVLDGSAVPADIFSPQP